MEFMALNYIPKKINKYPQATKIEHFCTHISMKGIIQGNQCTSKWIKCSIL